MKLKSVILPALFGISAFTGIAQDDQSTDKKTEKFTVTGSRIKRIDIEGPSTVVIISGEDIMRSGHTRMTQYFQNADFLPFGQHGNEVQLKGLGVSRTLVLLNGRRTSFSLDDIPTSAIERVEILKDGSSAVYGSDAVGGVVNFILKKDKNGGSAGVTFSSTPMTDTFSRSYDFSFGITSAKSSLFVLYQQDRHGFSNSTKIPYATDRDLPGTTQDITHYPKVYGSTVAFGCPAEDILNTEGGQVCRPLGVEYFKDYPQGGGTSNQTLVALEHIVNESNNLTVFADFATAKHAGQKGHWGVGSIWWAYNVSKDGLEKIKAGADPKYKDSFPWPTLEDGKSMAMAVGTRSPLATEVFAGVIDAKLGIKGTINDNYEWSVHMSEAAVDWGWHMKDLDMECARNAVRAGEVNPFEDIANAGFDKAVRAKCGFYSWVKEHRETKEMVAQIAGEVAQFGDWVLNASSGLSQTRVERDYRVDKKTMDGKAGVSFGGSRSAATGCDDNSQCAVRESSAFFAEANLQNEGGIEVSTAGRFDSYKNFGSTFNPSLGLKYRMDNLMFRTIYSTSFRTPGYDESGLPNRTSEIPMVDEVACKAAGNDPAAAGCQKVAMDVSNGGNPDLKPEKGSYMKAGMVASYFGVDFMMDAWSLTLKDAINNVGASDLLKSEADGVDIGGRVDRSGSKIKVSGGSQNIGRISMKGIDYSLGYKYQYISLKLVHNHLATYLVENIAGADAEQKVYQYGNPRWKNTLSINASPMAGLHTGFHVRSTGPFNHRDSSKDGQTKTYREFDLNVTYDLPWNGKMTLAMNNVTNALPEVEVMSSVWGGNNAGFFTHSGSTGRKITLNVEQYF